MMKKIFFVAVFCALFDSAFAQIDYSARYTNGKQLYREQKYNLAMETLKPLLTYDARNPYAAYASFYYALAAYHQGYLAVAKNQLNQIRSLHPKWDKLDEVNFWLARIHFDNRDYFQGLKVLSSISDKKFQSDIQALKAVALKNVTDIETLKMMREEHPKDEIVMKRLARALANNLSDPANKELLESIIDANGLKRADYIPEAPKTFKKEKYSVSVMMPFMVNTLEPTPVRKRNQIVLDFYEGMKLAADTLAKQDISISLRAYDTERDNAKIRKLLATEELINTDLIVGPFFQEEGKPLLDFAIEKRVNIINPFFNNSELIENNPYSYLFQPSLEVLGGKSGEFLASLNSAKNKNCLVFYGPTKRDSIITANFVQSAGAKGLKIVATRRIPKDGVRDILSILATPTEYDEFKYPKEFTLKKDSIGSIFVASDDPLLYVKVVSGVETRGDKIVVLGQENWLDNSTLDYEKYQTLPIVLAAPNYIDAGDENLKAFLKKYIKTHGKVPSAHAKMGYELMLFAGHQLREYGVYFQEGLNEKGFFPGWLYQGYNYQYSRSNQFIPFIQYRDDRLKVINR